MTMTAAIATNVEPISPAVHRVIERGERARWIRRMGSKERGFWYEDAHGRRVTDKKLLERIRALVLPPAWQDVHIAPNPRNCLQAVGIDKSGRIQYRYHPAYCARQQRRKFEKIEQFGERLPLVRATADEDIGRESFDKRRVLAIVIRLINELHFRVGSERSVERHRTFGITTLRNRHLLIKPGGRLCFNFLGKHQVRWRPVMVDEHLCRVMRELKAIGGPKVFEYIDAEGKVRPVTCRDVNEYIKSAAGPEFSAKDFRTWAGTLLAALALAEIGPAASMTAAKRNVSRAVRHVAERLGNTPTVCRKSYIHPAVFEVYHQGVTLDQFRPRHERRRVRGRQPGYEPEEEALVRLLRAARPAPCEGMRAARETHAKLH